MQEVVKDIYNLIYSPLVTPHNLLENCKLKNYNYVKYYVANDELVCEMECQVAENSEQCDRFYYFFSEDNYLQRIERDLGNEEREVLFDRLKEIATSKQSFMKRKLVDETA